MPTPKPNRDQYEYPSDAGIMGEDYQNDQARFTEVTDKELEAFQKVVTEIATGKEAFTTQELKATHELAEQQKLGRIYTLLEDVLQVAKRLQSGDTLDIEDIEQALYDVGQMIHIVPTTTNEEDSMAVDTQTAEGVAKILGDFANRSSARSDKELAEELGNQHRTLQQAITRIFVEWMRHLHGQAGQLGHYDDRNKASVMLAHAMFEDIAPEKLHLPLI